MRSILRKIYTLPVIWQLFTIPVLVPGFTLEALKKSAEDRQRFPWAYWLLYLVCLVELGALFSWYTLRFSGRLSEYLIYAQSSFALSALTLLAVSGVYAYRHRAAFWEFVAKSEYGQSRTNTTSTVPE